VGCFRVGELIAWRARVKAVTTRGLLELCALRHARVRWVHAPLSAGGGLEMGRWRIDEHEVGGRRLHLARLEGPEPQALPSFLGREVTDDPRYRASWIAANGLPRAGHALWDVVLEGGEVVQAELHEDLGQAMREAREIFG